MVGSGLPDTLLLPRFFVVARGGGFRAGPGSTPAFTYMTVQRQRTATWSAFRHAHARYSCLVATTHPIHHTLIATMQAFYPHGGSG